MLRKIAIVLLVTSSLVLSACKVVMKVPEGGRVESQSGTYSCEPGQTCEVDISDIHFEEIFTAQPNEGWIFAGWAKSTKKRPARLCGRDLGDCTVTSAFMADFPELTSNFDSEEVIFYLQPVFREITDSTILIVDWDSVEACQQPCFGVKITGGYTIHWVGPRDKISTEFEKDVREESRYEFRDFYEYWYKATDERCGDVYGGTVDSLMKYAVTANWAGENRVDIKIDTATVAGVIGGDERSFLRCTHLPDYKGPYKGATTYFGVSLEIQLKAYLPKGAVLSRDARVEASAEPMKEPYRDEQNMFANTKAGINVGLSPHWTSICGPGSEDRYQFGWWANSDGVNPPRASSSHAELERWLGNLYLGNESWGDGAIGPGVCTDPGHFEISTRLRLSSAGLANDEPDSSSASSSGFLSITLTTEPVTISDFVDLEKGTQY